MAHHAVDCHHCMRIGSSSEESLDPRFCEMCFWCDCERDGFCELQALNREYHVDVLPYIQHEHDYENDDSLDSVIRNPNKCIKCRRCGHCVDVCPVGAIYMKEHKDEVLYMTHSYDVNTVAQVSENIIPEMTQLFKVEKGAIRRIRLK